MKASVKRILSQRILLKYHLVFLNTIYKLSSDISLKINVPYNKNETHIAINHGFKMSHKLSH